MPDYTIIYSFITAYKDCFKAEVSGDYLYLNFDGNTMFNTFLNGLINTIFVPNCITGAFLYNTKFNASIKFDNNLVIRGISTEPTTKMNQSGNVVEMWAKLSMQIEYGNISYTSIANKDSFIQVSYLYYNDYLNVVFFIFSKNLLKFFLEDYFF